MQVLTDIYDDQARIAKLEEDVGAILLSREARNPQNAMVTLIMVKDNYHGWSFDRTPALLKKYDEAIKLLGEKE